VSPLLGRDFRGIPLERQKGETRITIQFGLLMGGTRCASSLPGRCCSILVPPESELGWPLSTVILGRPDQRHPDADDPRDAEIALKQS
jgi:hypothetical protein